MTSLREDLDAINAHLNAGGASLDTFQAFDRLRAFLEDFEKVTELAEKATPGEWVADLNHEHPWLGPSVRGIASMLWGCHENTPEAEAAMVAEVEANAALIVAARNFVEKWGKK